MDIEVGFMGTHYYYCYIKTTKSCSCPKPPDKEKDMLMLNVHRLRINLPLLSTVLPSNSRLFLSCRPFVVITTFSTGLVDVEVTSVSWLGQLTVGV